MYVIGTAGHVDHGKSTLVKALTNGSYPTANQVFTRFSSGEHQT